jgi:cytochrome P450
MVQVAVRPIECPNLASPRFKADPFPFFARLRAEAPVYRATLPSGQAAWLLSCYDDALAVLKDHRLAKDRLNALTPEQQRKAPWVPAILKPIARNMLDLDAPDHTRLRALVHKAFTSRLIERLRERVQTLCDQLLDTAVPEGQFDLMRDYAVPLPTTIIAELLGIPTEDRAKFHAWSKRMVSASTGVDLLAALPSIWLLIRYLRALFVRRRADPRDDLVTALVQAEEAGDSLSEDELLGMVVLLLIAGHETTVNLIGNATLALLRHPEQLDCLRRSPDLIKPAVEELARFAPPVFMATERYARADIEIDGVTISRGELVLAVIGSANRDERQFSQPDQLDITRDPNRHLAFGQGAHYCVGSPLARLEVQIAINTLIRRLPDMRLAVAREALRWNKGVYIHGLEALPLRMA